MLKTRSRMFAVTVAAAAIFGVGCSKSANNSIKASSVETRAALMGKRSLVDGGVAVDGKLTCKATVDDTAHTATYTCTGKTTDGKPIVLNGTSTRDELRSGDVQHSFKGTITATVGGVQKLNAKCVGSKC